MPIKKYIGINNASKNMNKEIKSPLMKTPLTAKCNASNEPINPLLSACSLPIDKRETITNNEVNKSSNVDIPEIPRLISSP